MRSREGKKKVYKNLLQKNVAEEIRESRNEYKAWQGKTKELVDEEFGRKLLWKEVKKTKMYGI